MFNFNIAEVFSHMESPLLEEAKGMEKISDNVELDKPITNYVSRLDEPGSSLDEDIDMDDIITIAYESIGSGRITTPYNYVLTI